MNLTTEQQAAIGARGKTIVSASAGSGKTFVMIERLVALIDGGVDVRSILAVTFTKSAAAQMRDRLRTALLKGIAGSSGGKRERLKEQLAALPLAEINTIHSFCGHLIRTNFFKAGVDPAFRILSEDDTEGAALRARALDSVFERAYERMDDAFSLLLSVYFSKKQDGKLRGLVSSLYEELRALPGYRTLLEEMGRADEFDAVCAFLCDDLRRRAAFIGDGLRTRLGIYRAVGGQTETLACALLGIAAPVAAADDLFAMRITQETDLPDKPRRKPASDEEAEAKEFLSAAKDETEKIVGELSALSARETEHTRYLQANAIAHALGELILAYDDAFAEEKREAGVLDYNDLEQFALRLLSDESVRAAAAEKYRYVFVDEYQDVNPVQEAILSAVGGGDVFLVGDEKQAIYGFRGSRSEFFVKKTETLANSLRLSSNFRSAPEILAAVNQVFAPLVKGYVPMQGGSRYGGCAGEVKFHLLAKQPKKKKEREGVYSVAAERGKRKEDPLAEKVASLVAQELGKEWYDADAAQMRKVRFGDIAVISRRREGEAANIAAALMERGIPVAASAKVNVCDFYEARLMLDWLSYLDNAEQDIPMTTALLSEVGGLTEGELAQVRLARAGTLRRESFRAACRAFAAEQPQHPVAKKLAAFFELTRQLRVHAQLRTAEEVMNELLALGLEAQIAAKEGGDARLARVRRLAAAGADAGVTQFLARLGGKDAKIGYAESGGEDAVRIVTIHGSKGLEYPVVIFAGADVGFAGGTERDEVLCVGVGLGAQPRTVIAPKSYDLQEKTSSTTLLRRVCCITERRDERREARNLLYVAMTRAKYRLHIVFADRGKALSPDFASRLADLVDLRACGSRFVADEEEAPALPRASLVHAPDAALTSRILSVYEKPYAYAASVRLPVKSSATALLRQQTPSAEEFFADGDVRTGREEGVAYHAFLQHVCYGEDAARELERMRGAGLLTAEQAALLDVSRLSAILAVPCLAALKGRRVLREQRFLVRLQADEMLGTDATDEIVFQGAIDLLAEDEQGYLLIDYKYSALSDAALKEKYAVQIALYKKAAARVLKIDENTIRARIVNIALCREIEL